MIIHKHQRLQQWALCISSIFFLGGMVPTTQAAPLLPTILGQASIEGLNIPGKCLNTSAGALSLSACELATPFLQASLFGGNSLMVKNALGYCLRAGAAVEGSKLPQNALKGVFYACEDGSNAAQYDPATQQVRPASNPASCLAAVYSPVVINDGQIREYWEPVFIGCDIASHNGQPVYKAWAFTALQNPPKPTPSLVNQASGSCLSYNTQSTPAQLTTEACSFGEPTQFWHYNANNQITNDKGQCLAVYAQDPQTVVDACKVDANHAWGFVSKGQMLKNSATGQCLMASGVGVADCGDVDNPSNLDRQWYFIEPPSIKTTNNLAPKEDNYGKVANIFFNQAIDIPAAKGVRLNDTPSGWPAGLIFELVSPIARTTGSGKATAELYFRDTGGFYIILRTHAKTMAGRMADKRGTYQFTYKMVMNGQSSAPATVTLNIF